MIIFFLLFSSCLVKANTISPIPTITVIAHIKGGVGDEERFLKMLHRSNFEFRGYVKFVPKIFYMKKKSYDHARELMQSINDESPIHVFFTEDALLAGEPFLGIIFYNTHSICDNKIVITDSAIESTLSHELGHNFRLNHEPTSTIMSRFRSDKKAHFSKKQKKKIKNMIMRYVKYCL